MHDRGLDICHRFDALGVADELALPLLADPARPVGLLVGNSRVLWPHLRTARDADPALAAAADPVDRYTEQLVEHQRAAVDGTAFYAHQRYEGAFLPFQRIAVAAGLAALAPTHLLIHPIYGPWFALRAVILVAGERPGRTQVALPCTCDDRCTSALTAARASKGSWRAWLAVRDACPVGREYRYSDDQIGYHYTKDRRFLG